MKNYAYFFLICLFFACAGESTEPEKKPNILFCIMDDASFPFMGAYGTSWVTTPAFDRIAKEGLLFNRAYTPNAKCAPSRACIITARNSWELEEAGNHVPNFPNKFESFVEVLGSNGYKTGYTGKGWSPGNPGVRNGMARELTGKNYSDIKREKFTMNTSPIDYAANFKTFMKERNEDEPFFFWYGGKEPHRRYEYGSGARLTDRTTASITKVPDFWPDNEIIRNDMLDYALEVDYFDQHLGEMLAELERNGQLENTIIVVTSDNGMPFPRIKGQEYELSNHLPLAIMWPEGIEKPGREVDDLVNFIDFAPTFLDYAGVEWTESAMSPTTGKSLRGVFENTLEQDFRDYILIGKERHDVGRPDDQGYPIRGIVQGEHLFIKNYEVSRWPAGNPETGYPNTDGSPTKTEVLERRREDRDPEGLWKMNFGKRPEIEVFNIKDDPYCMNNLANEESLSGKIAEMQDKMVAELRKQDDPRMFGNGAIFDNYPYTNPAANLYNRLQAGEEVSTGWIGETDREPETEDMQ